MIAAVFLSLYILIGATAGVLGIIVIEQGFGRDMNNYHGLVIILSMCLSIMIGMTHLFPY